MDLAPALDVTYQDKIPRLGKSDAGGVMCRDQDPRNYFVGHRLGTK
jgi:hypothetical protein